MKEGRIATKERRKEQEGVVRKDISTNLAGKFRSL